MGKTWVEGRALTSKGKGMFPDIRRWSGLLDIGDNGGDALGAFWDKREMLKRTTAAEELIVDYVEQ